MPNERSLLKPGHLWGRIQEQTAHALECGSLQSIPTRYEFIEHHGIRFLVRVLANLVRKDQAKQKQDRAAKTTGQVFNPFLPYEKDLYVGDLSDTHVCLLNKYNVVDHHLLIVTRAFEQQDNWLNMQDFEALWACMAEIDGLAFYNGGKIAGASQRHKHLQLVPMPLSPDGSGIPIETAVHETMRDESSTVSTVGVIKTLSNFPFVHAVTSLDPDWSRSPSSSVDAARGMFECYRNLLDAIGLTLDATNPHQQSGAYNLLATRDWMLIVPRSQESFESISVNSLGFAGSLFVRDDVQKERLKTYGPMTVLHEVGISRDKLP
ncbi:MAG: ATP adenylyltransferase family protein [Elainellaceae cyanobacterium]